MPNLRCHSRSLKENDNRGAQWFLNYNRSRVLSPDGVCGGRPGARCPPLPHSVRRVIAAASERSANNACHQYTQPQHTRFTVQQRANFLNDDLECVEPYFMSLVIRAGPYEDRDWPSYASHIQWRDYNIINSICWSIINKFFQNCAFSALYLAHLLLQKHMFKCKN